MKNLAGGGQRVSSWQSTFNAGSARVRVEPFEAIELELAFLWGEL
jgi:hypothetical protein